MKREQSEGPDLASIQADSVGVFCNFLKPFFHITFNNINKNCERQEIRLLTISRHREWHAIAQKVENKLKMTFGALLYVRTGSPPPVYLREIFDRWVLEYLLSPDE